MEKNYQVKGCGEFVPKDLVWETSKLEKRQPLENSLPTTWMKTLFLRFTAIWGKKWSDQVPNDELLSMALHDWGTGLYGMPGEHIKFAIEHCKKTLIWPPSLAEFIKACNKNANNKEIFFVAGNRPTTTLHKVPESFTKLRLQLKRGLG